MWWYGRRKQKTESENEAVEEEEEESENVSSHWYFLPLQMCAHRYRQWNSNPKGPHLLTGHCYLLGDDLNVDEEKRNCRRVVCEDEHLFKTQHNHDWFAYCQQGHGASFAKDGQSLLFGAPGAYQWKGEEGKKQLGLVLLFVFLDNLEGLFINLAVIMCKICFPSGTQGVYHLCTFTICSGHLLQRVSSAKTGPPRVDQAWVCILQIVDTLHSQRLVLSAVFPLL